MQMQQESSSGISFLLVFCRDAAESGLRKQYGSPVTPRDTTIGMTGGRPTCGNDANGDASGAAANPNAGANGAGANVRASGAGASGDGANGPAPA
jgi:hypothetical protein